MIDLYSEFAHGIKWDKLQKLDMVNCWELSLLYLFAFVQPSSSDSAKIEIRVLRKKTQSRFVCLFSWRFSGLLLHFQNLLCVHVGLHYSQTWKSASNFTKRSIPWVLISSQRNKHIRIGRTFPSEWYFCSCVTCLQVSATQQDWVLGLFWGKWIAKRLYASYMLRWWSEILCL